VAAYSGLIIFYLGKTVGDRLEFDSRSTANRLREMEDRQRIAGERLELETQIARCRQRIRQSRREDTRQRHEQELAELEEKYKQLNKTVK
jgi:flagellar motility protein MotE (MotC chaperone)